MNKYKVKVYVGTLWSFLTQADHYDEYDMVTSQSLEELSKRLARDGFQADHGKKWIMPGAILEIRKV